MFEFVLFTHSFLVRFHDPYPDPQRPRCPIWQIKKQNQRCRIFIRERKWCKQICKKCAFNGPVFKGQTLCKSFNQASSYVVNLGTVGILDTAFQGITVSRQVMIKALLCKAIPTGVLDIVVTLA